MSPFTKVAASGEVFLLVPSIVEGWRELVLSATVRAILTGVSLQAPIAHPIASIVLRFASESVFPSRSANLREAAYLLSSSARYTSERPIVFLLGFATENC